MYSLNYLNVFVQAAQSVSFAEAASLLGMTPSAVGKVVQKLETQQNIAAVLQLGA